MPNTTHQQRVHEGHNIKRFREMHGIKQEAFAKLLGNEWNQRKVSTLEDKETIDPSLLPKLAEVLQVSVEAIKSFDEKARTNIFSDNYTGYAVSAQYNFNPIDKWIEALNEKVKLYERLLESESKHSAFLEQLLDQITKEK